MGSPFAHRGQALLEEGGNEELGLAHISVLMSPSEPPAFADGADSRSLPDGEETAGPGPAPTFGRGSGPSALMQPGLEVRGLTTGSLWRDVSLHGVLSPGKACQGDSGNGPKGLEEEFKQAK